MNLRDSKQTRQVPVKKPCFAMCGDKKLVIYPIDHPKGKYPTRLYLLTDQLVTDKRSILNEPTKLKMIEASVRAIHLANKGPQISDPISTLAADLDSFLSGHRMNESIRRMSKAMSDINQISPQALNDMAVDKKKDLTALVLDFHDTRNEISDALKVLLPKEASTKKSLASSLAVSSVLVDLEKLKPEPAEVIIIFKTAELLFKDVETMVYSTSELHS